MLSILSPLRWMLFTRWSFLWKSNLTEEQLDYLDLLNAPQEEGEENLANYEVAWSTSTGNPLTIRLKNPFSMQGSYEETARDCLHALEGLYKFTDPTQRFQDLRLISLQEIPRPRNAAPAGKVYKLEFRQYFGDVPKEYTICTAITIPILKYLFQYLLSSSKKQHQLVRLRNYGDPTTNINRSKQLCGKGILYDASE